MWVDGLSTLHLCRLSNFSSSCLYTTLSRYQSPTLYHYLQSQMYPFALQGGGTDLYVQVLVWIVIIEIVGRVGIVEDGSRCPRCLRRFSCANGSAYIMS